MNKKYFIYFTYAFKFATTKNLIFLYSCLLIFFFKNIIMKDYKSFMINNNIIIKKYFTLTFLFLSCFF